MPDLRRRFENSCGKCSANVSDFWRESKKVETRKSFVFMEPAAGLEPAPYTQPKIIDFKNGFGKNFGKKILGKGGRVKGWGPLPVFQGPICSRCMGGFVSHSFFAFLDHIIRISRFLH